MWRAAADRRLVACNGELRHRGPPAYRRRLAKALLDANERIRVFVRPSAQSRTEEARALLKDPRIEVIEGALTDRRAPTARLTRSTLCTSRGSRTGRHV